MPETGSPPGRRRWTVCRRSIEDHPGVLVVTGFGPLGLTVAPFAGAILGSIALGEVHAADVSPLRPGRFMQE